ncbi:ABC transporter permease [Pediococcus pentosaceus]|jgi:ABC-2 type transport system permease protein|uniref:ABC transporter permease n=1 Tax=Pediococcus pentosaceus TaxID=1255 RepID=UPI00223B43B6|nr:ABC transporter permease [Pediococcus pentosaceus]MCT1177392.1 ABC transporter permease [Pediococcus pentosaceus]
MRIIAITNRVLKELMRDKRTLALMFLAPILILVLMSFIFNNSGTTNVKVGTVGISHELNQNLDTIKHVKIHQYASEKSAKIALKAEKADAIIEKDGNNFNITYANTDATKTATTKMAFKNAVTVNNIKQLKKHLGQSNRALNELQTKLALVTKKSVKTKSMPATQASPKIKNHYVYGDANTSFFDKILPILMGFFVFFFVFLVSGMALLKERTSGTLDRLLATPVKRSEIVFGYMLSYGIIAILQTIVIVLVTIGLLGVEVVGNIGSIIVINLLLALVALAFGILLSTFAHSEFQMMQFIPIVIVPQVFFAGIIPLDTMADWVQKISYIIPLKYAGDAVSNIIMRGARLSALGGDIGVLLIFLVILTILNIVGLKRYRKV